VSAALDALELDAIAVSWQIGFLGGRTARKGKLIKRQTCQLIEPFIDFSLLLRLMMDDV